MQFFSASAKQPVQAKDGRLFKVIEDRLFLSVVLTREYEADLSAIAFSLIQQGDAVVDVGANFGWYTTLFALRVGPGGRVYSFEPFPQTFEVLRSNVELNGMSGSVVLNNVCVAEVAGEAAMVWDSASNSGLAHVATDISAGEVRVASVRLDDSLEGLDNQIAYVKIDIEGFELKALKGMPDLLKSANPPIIQIELNDAALQRAASSRQELVSLLKNQGYRFFTINKNHPQRLKESDAKTESDVFCMPPGRYAQRILQLSRS